MSSKVSFDLNTVNIDNIEDYKNLQNAFKDFRNKAELLKTMILANPFPMIVLDTDGYLILSNDSSMELFGSNFLAENYGFLDNFIMKKFNIYKYFAEVKNGKTIKLPVFCYKIDNTNTKWVESVLCPILDNNNKIEYYLFMFADISREIKLKKENNKLKKEINEIQITINNLKSILKDEKEKIKQNTLFEIKHDLLDKISGISDKNETETMKIIKKIEKSISNMSIGLYDNLISQEYGLTPTEIKICRLIRSGLSGKETASELNIMYSTLHSHIKNIRKKLKLTGSGRNLQKYLMELS
jgi:DNA-binding CsgD family transcriptional regulator